VLCIPAALAPLAEPLGCELIRPGVGVPPTDYACELLSLPRAFGTTLETIPAPVPYLRSAPADRAAWQARLGPAQRPRVGLVWSGNAAHVNDSKRSIALAQLVAALQSDSYELVSLQKDVRPADAAALRDSGMHDPSAAIASFADTAALVDCMDLVVSVDTSVAHLVGALGKPLWVLLAHFPDWRWLLDREDSPWYPSARLFRQDAGCRWEPVLARVREELERRFAAGARSPASA
jgi:ADP-heptose:LPS heptosyltransferase